MAVFRGTAAADRILGGAEADQILGLEGNDRLYGMAGNDVLYGGAGDDAMVGGAGDDTYDVDSTGDVAAELPNEGIDRVRASVSHHLGANIEILILTGSADLVGAGNALDNTIVGNAGANTLAGAAGDDVLIGGAGNDVYDVDSAGDQAVERAGEGHDRVRASVSFILGANVEELDLGGTAGINGTGNGLANRIVGNAGANLLDGGAGADVLIGGGGDDIYLVDSAGDQVVEAGGQGTDLVRAWVSYALAGNVEILMLMGVGNIGGIGNAQDNTIFGNAGANALDGGAGDDVLIGGAGNDTYYLDSANDQVVEAAGGGADRVFTSVSHVLGANVEALTLTGFANLSGTGNALDNTIIGNARANALDGGAGDDVLTGGSGNDVYTVDSVGDRVVEAAGEGVDQVQASVSYRLGANIETLILIGIADINGVGNDLANAITGNAGANVLNGGAGDDTLIGGAGDDIYIVDSSQDRVIETANGGVDWIRCTGDYELGDNEENLMLIDNMVITLLTGNSLDNIIVGNSGFDWMHGGAGNDTLIGNAGRDILRGESGNDIMLGGAGDDQYDVESTGDLVKELAGEGIDLVHSYVNYKLTDNVENLSLEGYENIRGTGNALDNDIVGNSRNNILCGSGGADRLTGDSGTDWFLFVSTSDGLDTITDFNRSEGDKLVFHGLQHGTFAYIGGSAFTAGGHSEARFAGGQVFVDTDGDGTAEITVNVTGNYYLQASDFVFS
ncbi:MULTISPECIES: calcium-binding protein [Inquilinus]|uniref:Ca2+-binding RTX toxin-like protein n=1 Tax=Inquilinus ginsengisoli TaxID=363840 RepID=A0ABU1JMD5_9PROT|nr:calcium-binding protein [Inquilinus ginsengisoli]MDR6289781.1 Ca2+-binding RTX toxin-like protein [Inquilinus ginsengisoli]